MTTTLPELVQLTPEELATVHTALARRLQDLQGRCKGWRFVIRRMELGQEPPAAVGQWDIETFRHRLAAAEEEASRLVALLPLFAA